MKTLTMEIELTYDDVLAHSVDADKESRDWFFNCILMGRGSKTLRLGSLTLHSNEIGDSIGTVRVLRIGKKGKMK